MIGGLDSEKLFKVGFMIISVTGNTAVSELHNECPKIMCHDLPLI